ncbi:MAG: type II secretion system protein [Planctomycetota bacterium]|jgi:prepilin-type N-terminal cleavage/methylation domain-containing protein/prepilin-type processing-associated H-X9-DG protein
MNTKKEWQDSESRHSNQGFTLIELLVVIAIIGTLISISVPGLSRVKEIAKRTKCLSNVRQLEIALQLYTERHEGHVPPREYQAGAVWVDRLESYYTDRDLLHCPTDKKNIDQSYLMNGFIDYFAMSSFSGDWDEFFGAYKSGGFEGMKLSDIPKPADTITFGEKRADSDEDSYMDIWPPDFGGSDHLTEVAHGKHGSRRNVRSSGSNYAFADGSVRFLKYGTAFSPKNLWAVTSEFRNAPLPDL